MRKLFYVLLLCALAAGCDQKDEDPGPLVAAGWIKKCKLGCEQLADCIPDQLLWDHGDLDNCKRTCGVDMEGLADTDFIESTPEDCLEALYDKAGCIFNLECDDFKEWKSASTDDYPCMSKEQEAADACEGIDTEDFETDVGIPIRYTWKRGRCHTSSPDSANFQESNKYADKNTVIRIRRTQALTVDTWEKNKYGVT